MSLRKPAASVVGTPPKGSGTPPAAPATSTTPSAAVFAALKPVGNRTPPTPPSTTTPTTLKPVSTPATSTAPASSLKPVGNKTPPSVAASTSSSSFVKPAATTKPVADTPTAKPPIAEAKPVEPPAPAPKVTTPPTAASEAPTTTLPDAALNVSAVQPEPPASSGINDSAAAPGGNTTGGEVSTAVDGEPNHGNDSSALLRDDIDASVVEPAEPPAPTGPVLTPAEKMELERNETNERIFQELYGLASQPPLSIFKNPLQGINVDILYRIAGKTEPTFFASAAKTTGHPSNSLLLLIKRLNEEYRSAVVIVQDEVDQVMQKRRDDHLLRCETMRLEYQEKLKSAVELLDQEATLLKNNVLSGDDFGNSAATVAGGTSSSNSNSNKGGGGGVLNWNSDHASYSHDIQQEIEAIERRLLAKAANITGNTVATGGGGGAGGNDGSPQSRARRPTVVDLTSNTSLVAPPQMSQDDEKVIQIRRLLVYWKSRYQALGQELTAQEETMLSKREKLEEMRQLIQQEPAQVQRVLADLRELETKERLKTEALKLRYQQECKAKNVTPQEPRLFVPSTSNKDNTSSKAHSRSESISGESCRSGRSSKYASALASVGIQIFGADTPRAENSSPTAGEIPSVSGTGSVSEPIVTSLGGTLSGNNSPNGGLVISPRGNGPTVAASVMSASNRIPLRFLSEYGRRDAKVIALVKKLRAREEEEAELRRSNEEYQQQLELLQRDWDDVQTQYASIAGKVRGATAGIFEEIVSLRTKIEQAENKKCQTQRLEVDEDVRHATVIVTEVFETAKETLTTVLETEKARKSLREKELDVLRGKKKHMAGIPVTFQELSDTPVTNVALRVNALMSQLEVLDVDRQVLRRQINRAMEASANTDRQLNRRLGLNQ